MSEFENKEVRFYIDNCLRSRIKEGQIVKKRDGTMTQFRVPQNQQYIITISNPASAASWLPDWYRAETDNAGVKGVGGSDFRPTELHVDYVRYYVAQEVPVLVSSSGGWAHARTHAPSGGLQRLLKSAGLAEVAPGSLGRTRQLE